MKKTQKKVLPQKSKLCVITASLSFLYYLSILVISLYFTITSIFLDDFFAVLGTIVVIFLCMIALVSSYLLILQKKVGSIILLSISLFILIITTLVFFELQDIELLFWILIPLSILSVLLFFCVRKLK